MESLTEVRRKLGRLERALLRADAVIKEPGPEDADEAAFLKSRLIKQLKVWIAQLEGPPG